jgi:hypothetical protein
LNPGIIVISSDQTVLLSRRLRVAEWLHLRCALDWISELPNNLLIAAQNYPVI